jgi:hypothetical protein
MTNLGDLIRIVDGRRYPNKFRISRGKIFGAQNEPVRRRTSRLRDAGPSFPWLIGTLPGWSADWPGARHSPVGRGDHMQTRTNFERRRVVLSGTHGSGA